MRVGYFYGNRDWCRVHRADCADLKREARKDGIGSGIQLLDASSEREVIEDAASDFVFANDHQPWTDYVDFVSFAPCVKLPREDEGR